MRHQRQITGRNNRSEHQKVLFLAYIYPPLGGSGVQRTLKFTKYLPDFGWQPFVICGDDPCSIADGLDPSLLEEIPPAVQIWRRAHVSPLGLRRRAYRLLRMRPAREPAPRPLLTPPPETAAATPVHDTPLRRLLQALAKPLAPLENPPVDPALYWALSVVPGCLRLIRREKIDLIYSSSYPYSDHVAAWLLKRLTGLPWVADFRDPWTQNPLHRNHGWRFRVDRWVEGRVLRSADRVVCVTPAYTEGLRSLAPERPASDFITIENGYDHEDFTAIGPSGKQARLEDDKIELAHVGLLYDGTGLPVLQALEGLGSEASRIRCRFVGGLADQEQRWLAAHPLHASVEATPRLAHPQAVEAMRNADLLLLLIRDGADWKGHYPGKIFEYLASGTPILMVGPDGSAAELVRRTGTGWCFRPEDLQGIRTALRKFAEDPAVFIRSGFQPNKALIGSFSRKSQTESLARIFSRLLKKEVDEKS